MRDADSSRIFHSLYAVTIFVGAFLLFEVQPLIAKFILPWFGGAPAVWTVCVLFFQAMLLVGYAYADWVIKLGRRAQAAVHLTLLALGCLSLPIVPAERWKFAGASTADPTWQILVLLGVTVGLPYLAAASTGPLVQAWIVRRSGAAVASPYRLYALSNVASLGALLIYPALIEPLMSRRAQAIGWSVAFVMFAVISGLCAIATRASVGKSGDVSSRPSGRQAPPLVHRLFWVLLPACGNLLLLATTNKICQQVAVIPFLWILPLSLYLLSFIIAFDSARWYRRGVFLTLLPLAIAGVAVVMFTGSGLPIAAQLGPYCAAMFVGCMICHGELARLKPEPARLTGYYLTLSAGGALGGAFVAIVAPLIFRSYLEFSLGLLLTAVFAGAVLFTDKGSKLYNGRPNWAWLCLIVLFMLLGYVLLVADVGAPGEVVAASRSFYGTIAVISRNPDAPQLHNYMLRHGGITHGVQFQSAARCDEPTTYYGKTSGVGLALLHFMPDAPRRIGVVGLGAGTLATYGRPGDGFRFYEINPHVLEYAQTYFTFLKNSHASRIEHVLGDARLSLEREADQHFDLLILDAFNGDAIPVHLLSRQAFDLYRRHVKPGGVIAVHITNQHLDLRPVVQGAAEHLGLRWLLVFDDQEHEGYYLNSSEWMLLGPDEGFLESLPIRPFKSAPQAVGPRLWTDDQTSLFPILR